MILHHDGPGEAKSCQTGVNKSLRFCEAAKPALREVGVAAADVLYVGDSVTSDMAAARNAGMDFVWLNPDGKPVPDGFAPVCVIRDIREFPGCPCLS
jgi:phosphoglycolate phosphatase-like HAD superfamily hydrolase